MNELNAAAAPEATASAAKKRIAGIDLAETIAIFMVIVYHLSLYSYRFFEDQTLRTAINIFLRSFLAVCVPMFLVVNGYLLLNHELNIRKHIRKMVHLLILGMLWGIPTLLIAQHMEGTSMPLQQFILTLIEDNGTGPNIHLWYMGALLCVYIYFPLLKLAWDKNRQIFLFFLAFSFLCTFGSRLINQLFAILDYFGANEHYGEPYDKWVSIFNPYNGIYGYTFVYFALGGLLPDIQSWLQKHFPKPAHRNLFLAAVLLGAGILHTLWFLFLYWKKLYYICPIWYGYKTLTAIAMTMTLLLLCLNYQGVRILPCRLFRTVSDNTLGIYFLHMVVLLPIKPVIESALPRLCTLGGNLLISVAVLAVCLLITLIVRKIPGLRLLLQL